MLPAFEVASVKPTDPKTNNTGLSTYPGGRITASRYTLELLIEDAFDVQSFQISGGPRWINDDRYDIVAKPPASSQSSRANPLYPKAPPNTEQRKMLQALLIDRFQLKYHRESKEGMIYLLARGTKNLKLQDAKNKTLFPWAGALRGGVFSGDGLAGINESMADLAKRLGRYLGHLVLDKTGLTGSYDFRIEYTTADGSRPDVISSIISCLQDLGLKLEASRGQMDTIVIDSAARPSTN